MYIWEAMYIKASETGEKIQVSITKIDTKEIAIINKSKKFDFNWNKEKEFNVYKLTAIGSNEPLGLMSLAERPGDYAVEIRLLGLSKENIGSKRKYGRIAGCLIAFACKESIVAGYDGYVCLKPKTQLKEHYSTKYGLQSTKLFFITEGLNSLKLIEEYYED